MSDLFIDSDIKKYSNYLSSFILNRYDLWEPDSSDVFVAGIMNSDKPSCILFREKCFSHLDMGIWLTQISLQELKRIIKYVFNSKAINRIEYRNSLWPMGNFKIGYHFKIELPNSISDLSARLSSKDRYNMKREMRIALENFPDLEFKEYSFEDVPEDILNQYIEFKSTTHNLSINCSPKNYMKKQKVSNIYVLQFGKDKNEIMSIILSCEQCDVVYLENMAYSKYFEQYSPGKILYGHYLEELVKKGKKTIYLGGGYYSYKERYGSIQEEVYSGTIYRNMTVNYFTFLKSKSYLGLRGIYHFIRGKKASQEKDNKRRRY